MSPAMALPKDVALDACRIELHRQLGARPGVLELTRPEQEVRGFQLRRRVSGHGVGGPDELAVGVGGIAEPEVGLSQLVPNGPVAGVLLDGVAVLQHGLAVLVLGDVPISAGQVFVPKLFGIGAGGCR